MKQVFPRDVMVDTVQRYAAIYGADTHQQSLGDFVENELGYDRFEDKHEFEKARKRLYNWLSFSCTKEFEAAVEGRNKKAKKKKAFDVDAIFNALPSYKCDEFHVFEIVSNLSAFTKKERKDLLERLYDLVK